jgi:hypothetical protein
MGETRVTPLSIAIIGSCDPARKDELDLRNIDTAGRAGELLGKALAMREHQIVVYSSDEYYFEVDVVRGYCSVEEATSRSIKVCYSQNQSPPAFAEETDNREIFSRSPDHNPDWEFAFYQSLRDVDGAILLGGGISTLVAALFILSYGKPLIACAAFGGSARKIWGELSAQQSVSLEEEDLSLMATNYWTETNALHAVDLLQKQKDRIAQEQIRLRLMEQSVQTNLARNTWISAVLFILGLICWPLTWGISGLSYGVLLAFLIVAPLCTGAAGATIRLAIDQLLGASRQHAVPPLTNVALGLVAGGISAALFIVAQVVANPTDLDMSVQVEQLRRLVPFAIVIGFIAGLTLERVYGRLRETDVVRADVVRAPDGN